MVNLSPSMFITPSIVLVVIVVIYFYFKRKVKEKHTYRHILYATLIVAYVLNFVWELAHGPLYKGFQYDEKHIYFCALATLADVLMVLLLFFAFGLLFNDVFWTRNMNTKKVILLMLVGGLGANFSEMIHLQNGHWIYTSTMPLLPLTGAGVTPVLQFTFLPWFIFLIISKIIKKKVS